MMEFTKTLWMQDATTSLRNILKNEVAQVTKDYRLKLNLRLHKPRIVTPTPIKEARCVSADGYKRSNGCETCDAGPPVTSYTRCLWYKN